MPGLLDLYAAPQPPRPSPLVGLLGPAPIGPDAAERFKLVGGNLLNAPLAPALTYQAAVPQPTLGGLLGMALEVAPGSGDALAIQDFNKANQVGDRTGATLAAASLVPGVGELAGAAKAMLSAKGALSMAPELLGMTAYHGSPHDFDAFKLDKIGTGEGAQAYGHGLYFAENRAVANEYAGPLNAARETRPVGNVDLAQAYQSMPTDVPENLWAARRDFRTLLDMGELSPADKRDFLSAVQNNITASRGGKLYTVDIPDSAIEKMLDWDKPLSEQPEILKKLDDALVLYPYDAKTGKDIYQAIARNNHPLGGHNPEAASRLLNEAGIPGIKYLDQGSRGVGNGTRNFVVFDDTIPKIVKKE